MVRVLREAGGARQWLLHFMKRLRRINVAALSEVWTSAVEVDAVCTVLQALAEAAAARDGLTETTKFRCAHSSFLLMAAASDPLEECARHLAAWHHFHTYGDLKASNFIRFGPQPPEVIPLWLLRRGRREARARRRKIRAVRVS